jgi:hypothetical protein
MVLVSKFLLHLALNRQSEAYRREDVEIDESTHRRVAGSPRRYWRSPHLIGLPTPKRTSGLPTRLADYLRIVRRTGALGPSETESPVARPKAMSESRLSTRS